MRRGRSTGSLDAPPSSARLLISLNTQFIHLRRTKAKMQMGLKNIESVHFPSAGCIWLYCVYTGVFFPLKTRVFSDLCIFKNRFLRIRIRSQMKKVLFVYNIYFYSIAVYKAHGVSLVQQFPFKYGIFKLNNSTYFNH